MKWWRKRFVFFICVFLVISRTRASVLKDALEEHLKDVVHDEETESLKVDKHKGEKDHHIESQINDNHSNKHTKTTDDVKFLKKDHQIKAESDSDEFGGSKAKLDKAEDSQSNGFKRGHKKGHHKQGFQNSYHKDESSNKSTFFDDFNDEGDQAAYNNRLNRYDNRDNRQYKGSHRNGHEYLRDNYRGGGHNRYDDVGSKQVGHKDYGRNHYLKDSEAYNKYHNGRKVHDRGNVHDRREYQQPHVHHYDPGWDWQRWEDRRDWAPPRVGSDAAWDRQSGWDKHNDWERDYGGPGYYDDHGFRHDGGYGYGPHHGYGYGVDESRTAPVAKEVPANAPVVARRKQTITIYEDPRYSGSEKGQLRREKDDYIQLDIKPSTKRYASYDDTYYTLPTRDRSEASSINRLVYNYKRS
ncbi:unnamed protein product [Leptidea sinapis]|uniref:Uncharacterized protein n=1 Tax=Leptidea sinapis TaxID=189913 RepID=A0A5E4Q337_9NEOP|nr:unnamed protein product [Leptidea sinapis]